MNRVCEACGSTNGPEAVYCTECGVEGKPPEESAEDGVLEVTLARPPDGSRSTLVGSSSGSMPALLDSEVQQLLSQSLPRRVRIGMAGWTALVGGLPELSLSLFIAPLVAYGIILGTRGLIGFGGALVVAVGVALFLIIALLFGLGDTTRTLQAYRLARKGLAANGEITRRITRKSRTGASYFIEFTFTDARGIHQSGRQEVTVEQWQAAAERQPITILYRSDKPEDCCIYELMGVVVVPRALQAPAAD